MTELQTCPPPAEVLPTLLGIPNSRISPSVLSTGRGPDGGLGPEGAGAVMMLQATFTDTDKAARFWEAAAHLMGLLATAPGFISRYSFPDGPTITLIALWRTTADAKAFAATSEHRAAVRALYRERWQYSHFSAIWELASSQGRQVFCDECAGIAPASDGACTTCGAPFVDPYAAATE